MKIISTGGHWVNIDNGNEWITFNHWDGDNKIIKKDKWPDYDVAPICKVGIF